MIVVLGTTGLGAAVTAGAGQVTVPRRLNLQAYELIRDESVPAIHAPSAVRLDCGWIWTTAERSSLDYAEECFPDADAAFAHAAQFGQPTAGERQRQLAAYVVARYRAGDLDGDGADWTPADFGVFVSELTGPATGLTLRGDLDADADADLADYAAWQRNSGVPLLLSSAV